MEVRLDCVSDPVCLLFVEPVGVPVSVDVVSEPVCLLLLEPVGVLTSVVCSDWVSDAVGFLLDVPVGVSVSVSHKDVLLDRIPDPVFSLAEVVCVSVTVSLAEDEACVSVSSVAVSSVAVSSLKRILRMEGRGAV